MPRLNYRIGVSRSYVYLQYQALAIFSVFSGQIKDADLQKIKSR